VFVLTGTSQPVFVLTGRKRFISVENFWNPYKKNSKTTCDAGLDLSIHVNNSTIHPGDQVLSTQKQEKTKYCSCERIFTFVIHVLTYLAFKAFLIANGQR
jgi:hypothetical protein